MLKVIDCISLLSLLFFRLNLSSSFTLSSYIIISKSFITLLPPPWISYNISMFLLKHSALNQKQNSR